MSEFKKFTVTRRDGIDDLVSIYPYTEDEWNPKYTGDRFGITEREYKSDRQAYQKIVEEHNAKYVAQLKAKGEYGKEHQINFNFMTYPEFDQPAVKYETQILIPKGLGTGDIPKFNVKYNKDDEI